MESVTKELHGIEVEVLGTYTPIRYGVRYTANGDGYPDEPAEFSIEKVLICGVDITKALDKQGFDWRALEDEILEDYE